MQIVLGIFIGAIGGLLLLPTVSDGLSLLRAPGRRPTGRDEATGQQRLLCLVAAHNEELLIRDCIASLLAQHHPRGDYEILVIADNCTDSTARLAREAGAKCLERQDMVRRGKPWAIAWALERVDLSEFDAVVVIDADSVVDAEFASELTRIPSLRTIGVQSFNGVRNPDESALARMAAVLSTAYYEFAYPLKERAGLNVPLTGAGMCVGTEVLETYGWKAFSRSEDVELYVRLTVEGVRTKCANRARVYSQEARSLGQTTSQRQRWRGGRLEILFRLGPAVLSSRRIDVRQKLDTLCELITPGPAVHLAAVALAAVATLAANPPAQGLLLGLLAASLVRPSLLTLLAIHRQREPSKAIMAFLFLPIYAAWRLVAEVLALVRIRSAPWVRTERHTPTEGDDHANGGAP